MSATIKRYETHNKLLNLWVKLFPDVTCEVDEMVTEFAFEIVTEILTQ